MLDVYDVYLLATRDWATLFPERTKERLLKDLAFWSDARPESTILINKNDKEVYHGKSKEFNPQCLK